MRLIRIVISIAALLAPLALASVSHASFETVRYDGSRADIRAYCVGEGRTLVEHPDYTLCQDEMTGANHTCDALGACMSTGSTGIRAIGTGAADPVVTGGTAPGSIIPPVGVAPFVEAPVREFDNY